MTLPARLSIVTLGVADLDRSIAFYEALGWQRTSASIEGRIAWIGAADSTIGLFAWDELARDANLPPERTGRFGGITLAINVESPEAVTAGLDAGRRRRRHAAQAADTRGLGRDLWVLRGPGRPPMGGRPQSRVPHRRGWSRPHPGEQLATK
jgi:catechol 2,3-dioxygenase-like lactoylglutathione lyase family enzyme